MNRYETFMFEPDSFMEFRREKGHIYISVPIVRADQKAGDENSETLDLIFDTGAYITVISRKIARHFEFDKLDRMSSNLIGFNGREDADLVILPALKIGNRYITNVQALIPSREEASDQVLGMNVLEYFIYCVDGKSNRIYLKENDKPLPYKNSSKKIDLSCGGIYTINHEVSFSADNLDLKVF